MKRKFLVGVLMLCSCGCASMNNTESGALTGGVVGGALGAIVGAAFHRPLAGAAIGAGTGAVVGGVSGAAQDRREANINAANTAAIAAANQVVNGPVGLQEVATMVQQHISDSIIIGNIRSSGTTYNLRPQDIQYLKEQGVSDAIVTEMLSRRTVVQVIQPRPVYVQPAPVVGVEYYGGGGYYRRW